MRHEIMSLITCEVYQDLTGTISSALASMGFENAIVQSGRAIMLGNKSRFSIRNTASLSENLVDIYRFMVPVAQEQQVMSVLISAAMLDHEGRGSIYSEQVERLVPDGTPAADTIPLPGPESDKRYPMTSNLTGIACILQRGEGNHTARTALEMGICVPSVTFGTGAGLRDKLGLIRITIPAEKEIVSLVTTHHDAHGVLTRIVEAGKLDQPGKGFVFTYPISHGLINTRLHTERELAAATVGQIVTAIDEIKGTTGWRRKFTAISDSGTTSRKISFLKNLVALTVICQETQLSKVIKAAMDAGASGATAAHLRNTQLQSEAVRANLSAPPREQCTMIMTPAIAEDVANAVANAGLFECVTPGEMFLRKSPEAYTYINKK